MPINIEGGLLVDGQEVGAGGLTSYTASVSFISETDGLITYDVIPSDDAFLLSMTVNSNTAANTELAGSTLNVVMHKSEFSMTIEGQTQTMLGYAGILVVGDLSNKFDVFVTLPVGTATSGVIQMKNSANENVVTINNIDLSSGRASKTLSEAEWNLVSDKTKDCSLVLKLVSQNTYPLGTEIKLKRVSIDDTSVKFAMSFEYPSGDLYASYNVTALFSANAGMIFVNQVEANKERLPAGSQPLTNLTLCGHTFKVDSLKRFTGSITVDATGSGTITFTDDVKPDSDDVNKFLFNGTLTGGSFNQEIACIFSRGHDAVADDATSGRTYYEAFIQVYNGAEAPQKLCSVTLETAVGSASWSVNVKEIPLGENGLKKFTGFISIVDDALGGTISFKSGVTPDSDNDDKFLFTGKISGGSLTNQTITCIFSRGFEIVTGADFGIPYYEAIIPFYDGMDNPQRIFSISLHVKSSENWSVMIRQLTVGALPLLYLHHWTVRGTFTSTGSTGDIAHFYVVSPKYTDYVVSDLGELLRRSAVGSFNNAKVVRWAEAGGVGGSSNMCTIDYSNGILHVFNFATSSDGVTITEYASGSQLQNETVTGLFN